jgi:hypothetical protein
MNDDSFSLVDFPVDKWDILTLIVGLIFIVAFFYALIQIGGLPGKIAERRNHPHAEAVKYVGWIGLFTVFPYIHALIWAIHDSVTVDVRKMPEGSKWASVDIPPPGLSGGGGTEPQAGEQRPEADQTQVAQQSDESSETTVNQG